MLITIQVLVPVASLISLKLGSGGLLLLPWGNRTSRCPVAPAVSVVVIRTRRVSGDSLVQAALAMLGTVMLGIKVRDVLPLSGALDLHLLGGNLLCSAS